MILPTKHVRADRALIGVGAELIDILREPMTVSRLWNELRGAKTVHREPQLLYPIRRSLTKSVAIERKRICDTM